MNPVRKFVIAGAMGAAALVGGAIGASFIGSASAQTSTTQAPASSSADTDAAGRGAGGAKGPHQANGITETLLTGSDLSKATTAAQVAVPGATVERAETDADGDTYEVHMTKSDGSHVTVKLDSNFVVTKTVNGKG
jgi:uncharacterized membrane protein YkoI